MWPALAEVTFGHDFTDVERTGAGAGLNQGDIDLKNSVVYGGKIGYFLPEQMNWLGFRGGTTVALGRRIDLQQKMRMLKGRRKSKDNG